jgi:hypothetical protein
VPVDTTPSYGNRFPGENQSVAYPVRLLGTNVTIVGSSTNESLQYGIDVTNLAAFIAGYNFTNSGAIVNTNSMSINDAGFVQFSTLIETNFVGLVSGGATNFARQYQDSWLSLAGTLSGTIKTGGSSVKVNDIQSTLSEEYVTYTPFDGTNGERNVFIKPFGGGLDVIVLSHLLGKVVQKGATTFSAISRSGDMMVLDGIKAAADVTLAAPSMDGPPFFPYSGKGTVTSKTAKDGTTTNSYKATFTGVTYARGSSLKLDGQAGTLVNNYGILTNAPAVSVTKSNLLIPSPSMYFTVTWSQSGITNNLDPILFAQTPVNTTNLVLYYTDFDIVSATNTAFSTNKVDNAIKTLNVNGKLSGQNVKNLKGINQGDYYYLPVFDSD